jgi:hypothetical protein
MPLTWLCHVCGRERPDGLIAVYRRAVRHRQTGTLAHENVRYCRDRSDCAVGARAVTWTNPEHWEPVDGPQEA